MGIEKARTSQTAEGAELPHVRELAGLTMRMRQQLNATANETSQRERRMQEGTATLRQWMEALEPPYRRDLPSASVVGSRFGWWRKVWKEYQVHSAYERLLQEALPWLDSHLAMLEEREVSH